MKSITTCVLTIVILLLAVSSKAQIGIGTTTPDPSAQLEIKSDTKGLLLPRVTTTSSVTSPAKGLLVYQTSNPEGFYYNSGTPETPNWLLLRSSDTPSYWQLTGGNLTNINSGAVTITNLQVGNSSLALGGVIRYTGTDIEGYAGGGWKSLTAVSAPPQSYWATASASSNCASVCPTGYAPGADANGKTCKNAKNFIGTAVTRCTFSYTSNGVIYSEQRWGCDSPNQTGDFGYQLTQCHCIKVN